MRTASLLKYSAHMIMFLGLATAVKLFSVVSLKFWIMIILTLIAWLLLRLFALVGQLVYEIRNESFRILGSIERSQFQMNATMQEMRDLMDAEAIKDHE